MRLLSVLVLVVVAAQVSRWRRGRVVPRLEHLENLSIVFGVPRPTLVTLARESDNAQAERRLGAGDTELPTSSHNSELDALLDQDRSELHRELHDTPRAFWLTILEAQRGARRTVLAAVRQAQALSGPQPDQSGISAPVGVELALRP